MQEQVLYTESLGPLTKRHVIWSVETDPEHTMEMDAVYAPDGGYVGTVEYAQKLLDRGILPQLAGHNDRTCSIGFCAKEQKWYGWSHRAMYGFKLGDIVEEGDCTASPGCTEEYIAEHPELDLSLPVGFVARTMDDVKRMAIAFADSVG